jgi:hypothetical protein
MLTKYVDFGINFISYRYCIFQPTIVHVHLKDMNAILLYLNIGFCGLESDMGLNKHYIDIYAIRLPHATLPTFHIAMKIK